MEASEFKILYQGYSTAKLKDIAKDHESMRKDVLPILLDELENRQEFDFVDKIREEIENPPLKNDVSMGVLGTLIEPDSIEIKAQKKSDILDETLDDETDLEIVDEEFNILVDKETEVKDKPIDQFKDTDEELLDDKFFEDEKKNKLVLTDYDIVDLACRFIIKHKSKIKNWEAAMNQVSHKWEFTPEMEESLKVRLKKKARNLGLGALIVLLLAIADVYMLANFPADRLFLYPLIMLGYGAYAGYTSIRINEILKEE